MWPLAEEVLEGRLEADTGGRPGGPLDADQAVANPGSPCVSANRRHALARHRSLQRAAAGLMEVGGQGGGAGVDQAQQQPPHEPLASPASRGSGGRSWSAARFVAAVLSMVLSPPSPQFPPYHAIRFYRLFLAPRTRYGYSCTSNDCGEMRIVLRLFESRAKVSYLGTINSTGWPYPETIR